MDGWDESLDEKLLNILNKPGNISAVNISDR